MIKLLKMVFLVAPRTLGWMISLLEKDSSVKNAVSNPETPDYTNSSGIIRYKNNSERLKLEHDALKHENSGLYDLLDDLARFLWTNFEQELVITMIGRTQQEQDKIYAGVVRSDGRKYDERPWTSPHQYSHAADIRSRNFSEDEIREIEDYLNAKYNLDNYYRWTAKDHNVGLGTHFHIQFLRRDR